MRGIRVMHVDDDQQFREVTAEWLARLDDDFDIVTAGSVADALDMLSRESETIDCVVSDYDMPGTDGLDFLDAVRERYPQLPFLLFTGKGSEQVASDAMARDATDYLQKGGGREQYELLANRIRNAVEQYRSQRRIERQREEYRHLFEEAPVMFVTYRDEGGVPVVEDCNRRFAAKLGYDRAEIEGESIESFFTAESLPDAMDGYERVLAGEFSTGERILRTTDGDTLEVLVRGVPRTDASGTVTGVLALYVDVTERKERERELEEARQFYRTVVEESRDAVRIVQDGTMTFVDDRFVEMTGYPASELVGHPAEKVVAPEYEAVVRDSHDARMRDEDSPARYEVEIETADGDRRHVELSVATIEQDGEPASLSLFRDVSDRVEREQELRRQKERLDTIISNVPVVLFALDSEGVFTLSDGQGLEQLGLEPGEAVGDSVFDRYGDNEEIRADIERALAGERVSTTHEVRGAVFDTTLQPVLEEGAIEAVIGVAVDITERTERGRELRRFEAIVEALGDAVYAVDGERRLEYVNERYAEMKGLDQEELLGMSTERWADEEVIDRITELSEELKRGEREVAAVEYESRTADGETIPVENRFILIEFPDGEWGRVGVIRDISDRVERERELERERDRLDEFTSVVSHDLRNPLHTLDASLRLVDADDEHVARCRRAVDRMDRLIDDLLTLARRGDRVGDPEPLALAEVVTDAWRTVETADIDLTVETDVTVMADEGRLRQLFENLFRNAVEHGSTDPGPPGGADSVPGVEEVTVGTLPHGEGFFVADDGVGFPQSGPGRVFESGYSTDSDGVGLGLAIVEGIASGHGWDVTATESEGGGARFEFTGVDWQ